MDVGSIAYFCTANIFAMGTIQRQTIAGTIYTYIGVGVGFVTTALLMPSVLSTEEVGLLKLLVSFSVLFSTFANLGTLNVATKFFPYFRDEAKGHNGFLFLLLAVNAIGSLIVFIVFLSLKQWLVESNSEKSNLFSAYVLYVMPITFSLQFFNVFDVYFRMLYNAVKGTVAKEVMLRVALLMVLLAYCCLNFILFRHLVLLYSFAFLAPLVYLVWSAWKNGYLYLSPRSEILTRPFVKEMARVSILGVVNGLSGMLILHIDSIMVNNFLGLSDTGIYSTCFFFGTLIVMPARILKKIGGTFIAEAWKNNDLEQIDHIYKKSTVNQLLFGLLLFAALWVNAPLIFSILPHEYSKGLYVILFIGLANVIEMAGGVSVVVIGTSPKYIYNTYFVVLFVLMVVGTNYFLIPRYGITGAAVASSISIAVYKLMKYVFLLAVYGLQPYAWKHLFAVLHVALCMFVFPLLPEIGNVFVDALLKSTLLILIVGLGFWKLNFFDDLNSLKSKIHFLR